MGRAWVVVCVAVNVARGVAADDANATSVAAFAAFAASTTFSPVMPTFPLTDPTQYVVRDLTRGPAPENAGLACRLRLLFRRPATQSCTRYDVGKFNEKRADMYVGSHFENLTNAIDGFSGSRDVHVGLDLGAKPGTPVHAPLDGTIFGFGYNAAEKDYGHVVVTEHYIPQSGEKFWILYGHLNAASAGFKAVGDDVRAGQHIGFIGKPHENGGWPRPHLHLQISLIEPTHRHDMPGTVNDLDRSRALEVYADPRLIVGPLYPSS